MGFLNLLMGIHSIGVGMPWLTLAPLTARPCLWVSVIRSVPLRNFSRNTRFVRKRSALAVAQCNWTTSSDEEPFGAHDTESNFGDHVSELGSKEVVERLKSLRGDPRGALLYFAQVKERGCRHGIETYVAMMGILCRWGWYRKLDGLLIEIIKSEDKGLSFEMFELVEAVADLAEVEEWSCLVLVFDGLVKAYASLGMFDESIDVLFRTRKLQFGPCILSCNFLMNCLIERGKVDMALSVYQQLKNKGLSPNVYTYNLLIKVFSRKGSLEEISRVFDDMEQAGVSPNEYTYTTCIEGFCLHRRSDEGYNLLKNVRRYLAVQFDSFPYIVLINGFCNEMKLNDAEAVLADIETQGLTLTAYCFGPLIHAHCRMCNFERALSLHEEMLDKGVKTNCVILSSMFKCLCSMGLISEVVSLFERFKYSGLFFDEISYNVVVDALCKSGRVDEARDLFVEMEHKKLVPDLLHYSTLMNGYCLQGKLADAVDIFEQMKSQGLKPDVVAYNILASGFARLGFVEDALDLVHSMRAQGLEPDHATYNLIIAGLCIAGKLKEAEVVFDCIEEKCVDNYSVMVSGYCEANCTSEARKLFVTVYERGILLKRKACYKLLNNLCVEGETEYAFALFKILLAQYDSPCIRMCCKLIAALFEAGDVRKAQLVFDSWFQHGLNPDTVMYTIMISGYCKANYFLRAYNLFNDMKQRGVKPDVITYTVLLDGCLKDSLSKQSLAHPNAARTKKMIEMEMAMSTLWNEMIEAGIKPDVVCYTVLIDKHCKVNDLQEAANLLSQMIDRGLEPDPVAYSAFLSHYCGGRSVDILFDTMSKKGIPQDSLKHMILKAKKL